MTDQRPLSAGHGGLPETANEEGVPPASGATQITLPSVSRASGRRRHVGVVR